MALPFYVSPEQMMQDKAEYARKGIARGKSIVAIEYDGGIALVAENPSSSLSKISDSRAGAKTAPPWLPFRRPTSRETSARCASSSTIC